MRSIIDYDCCIINLKPYSFRITAAVEDLKTTYQKEVSKLQQAIKDQKSSHCSKMTSPNKKTKQDMDNNNLVDIHESFNSTKRVTRSQSLQHNEDRSIVKPFETNIHNSSCEKPEPTSSVDVSSKQLMVESKAVGKRGLSLTTVHNPKTVSFVLPNGTSSSVASPALTRPSTTWLAPVSRVLPAQAAPRYSDSNPSPVAAVLPVMKQQKVPPRGNTGNFSTIKPSFSVGYRPSPVMTIQPSSWQQRPNNNRADPHYNNPGAVNNDESESDDDVAAENTTGSIVNSSNTAESPGKCSKKKKRKKKYIYSKPKSSKKAKKAANTSFQKQCDSKAADQCVSGFQSLSTVNAFPSNSFRKDPIPAVHTYSRETRDFQPLMGSSIRALPQRLKALEARDEGRSRGKQDVFEFTDDVDGARDEEKKPHHTAANDQRWQQALAIPRKGDVSWTNRSV